MTTDPPRSPDRLPRWRRWLFRLLAATLVPVLLFGLAEVVLRIAGVGYPTDFFLRVPDTEVLNTNPRFGWRFFPPALARTPEVCRLPQETAPGSYRIFVLGGSAALGTPDSSFSFGRILEAMLRHRYPKVDFQVVNAAMTAINSHVVLEIAQEAARREPDLFLVYLGNNEVVGPFGPGTTFQRFTPPRTLIRLAVNAQQLRGAQLLGGLLRQSGPAGEARWRGMEMFLDNQISAEDPRLRRVYRDLRHNLEDLVTAAEGAGANVILSTVAVNLKDSPPFASVHGKDLHASDLGRWQESFDEGSRRLTAGDARGAREIFQTALRLDPNHADLRFRLGQAALADGDADAARDHFVAARDLDALRFRADSGVNGVIREVASAYSDRRVWLVDAATALAASPEVRDGILGDELLYEHVHFRFVGNHRLAALFFPRVEALLPQWIRDQSTGRALPEPVATARIIARTAWDRHRLEAEIYAMTRRPPFTNQLDHDARQARARTRLLDLEAVARRRAGADLALYRQASGAWPGNLTLQDRHAEFLLAHGRPTEAAGQWRKLLARLPDHAPWHGRLAFALADQDQMEEAETQARRAAALQPWSPAALVNLGTLLELRNRDEEAARSYQRALETRPDYAPARFNLGHLLEERGDFAAALDAYRQQLEIDPDSALAWFRIGAVHDRQEALGEAVVAYRRALELDPEMPQAHNNLGFALERQGETAAAVEAYRRAAQHDPTFALAHFNLGDALLTQGDFDGAEASYRLGLELEGENSAARRNLAAALVGQGRVGEAVAELRLIIARQPGFTPAVTSLAWLLATTPDPAIASPGEAVALAERAAADQPRDPRVLVTLSAALRAAGRAEEAREAARRALPLAREAGDQGLLGQIQALLAEAPALEGSESEGRPRD